MPVSPPNPGARSEPAWIPYFVLLVSVLVAIVAATYVKSAVATRDRLRLLNATQHTRDAIADRLDTYLATLRGVRALWSVSPDMSAASFGSFTGGLNLQKRYPGIQGVGFSRRIPAAELPALLRELAADGVYSWDVDSSRGKATSQPFTITPSSPRPEYHAIVYL